ncbi:preprotein translocase subunit SecG [Corynebacterium sp. TA-R-1]|uniref:Protein-export membrane protein SecG n=1 Tax=Corynebacterium stercoris TaxID=2943490 RepID=A0ABT1FZD1_9CORY|nr:preprotein translocase subunit SecG [Corynebacterium stercoris]MCP1387113.1 preprotein translocase subunit SecG [Corynebacterium stercoris]
MTLALEIVLVITSILMVVFVLLHKGKGGGLSTLFGGGVQANLSGSTTVEKNLDRVTVILCLIWIACIIGLNLTQTFAVPS